MGWFDGKKAAADKKPEASLTREQPPANSKDTLPESVLKPIPRQKLPKDLQNIIDKEDDFLDRLYDGYTEDSTDTKVRYAAYASRARTILLSAQRYVAYTSDIGESFRPVAHPYLVKGAYAVSWLYLLGDVSIEGYKAYQRNHRVLAPSTDIYKDATGMSAPAGSEASAVLGGAASAHVPAIEDWRAVAVQRAVFQSLASMGLPAFTIHSIVRYSGRAMRNVKNTKLRTWGPIGLGLSAVPALPFVFDEPVEEAVEWVFYNAFKSIGGEAAVGKHSATHRKHELKEADVQLKKSKDGDEL